jgi:thiamine-monophosphate kinase
MNAAVLENQMIEQLARSFRRAPGQMNRLNESDAEIVRLGQSGLKLAVTTDAIVEEIASGLYDDPRMIGWMAAMVNFSDLAAVGASPLGLLIAETFPPDLTDDFLCNMQRGIEEACSATGSFVLGGDTNSGNSLQVTGCAVGIVEGDRLLSRVGCRPGDMLYCSGHLGSGNAYAISRFAFPRARYPFVPSARIREGQVLRGLASACMDTSDGMLSTLDQLLRLNNCGFQLGKSWEMALDARASALAVQAAIAPWLLLAGQHGEFELLFTVSPENEGELLRQAHTAGFHPISLGVVIPQPEISLEIYGSTQILDTVAIRNAAFTARGSIQEYVSVLLDIDQKLQRGRMSS